jgi:hypothetical protein
MILARLAGRCRSPWPGQRQLVAASPAVRMPSNSHHDRSPVAMGSYTLAAMPDW